MKSDSLLSSYTKHEQTSNMNMQNLLMTSYTWPPFDQISPEHVEQGVETLLNKANELLAELESSTSVTWDDLIPQLEEIDTLFELYWSPVSHLHSVMNTPELREAYQAVLGSIVEFGLKLQQSESIYQRLKSLKESDQYAGLSPVRKRILDSKLHDAELSGIGLQGEEREEFNNIAKRLSELSTEFSNHVLDATKAFELIVNQAADTEGMPLSLRQLASQSYRQANPEGESSPEAGPWRFTLEASSYGPFMQHCPNSQLRQQMSLAFLSRASSGELDNSPLCLEILKLRKRKAQLLGYQSYAEVSLSEKMAPGVDAVWEMMETLREKSTASAKQDLETIHQMAEKAGQPIAGQWDYSYWAERLKEERYQLTDDMLRPYFQHEIVLQGMFDLVEHLFQIKVIPADGEAPVWQEDVRFFHIANLDGTRIASFYYDPYSRPETKRPGAWMNTCLSKRGETLPVAHLICNGTPPVGEQAALMSFREVETLFHEFGHGLQHMLTTVTDSFAAGISNVEWDAVELPSQFMENWCYHKPTLLKMTRHVETGAPLPDDLFEKLVAARTHWAGGMMLRQLVFGSLDMELHDRYDPESGRDLSELQKEVFERILPYPMHSEDRTMCSFSHIFAGGYAAGYYSYKWAEVLSADAFGAFEDAGLDDPQQVAAVGQKFRETILALGGGTHPMEVFKQFRGREPEPEALLRHSGLI